MGSPGGRMEQLSGASLEKGALDTTDGHMEVDHASERLDKQYEKMKVRMLLFLSVLGTPFRPEQVTSTSLLLKPGSISQFIVFDVSAALALLGTPLEYSPLLHKALLCLGNCIPSL